MFKSHVLENIDLYRTEVGDRFSMQKVKGDQDSDQSDRLAGNSVYAYLYPNMMINRYGPWMDTNIVVPKGNGIFLPKLFWPTMRKNCSSDQENLLKFEAEGQEFAKKFKSLEQFFQTVKGLNNIW